MAQPSEREFDRRLLRAAVTFVVAVLLLIAFWRTAEILLLVFVSVLLAVFLRTLALPAVAAGLRKGQA